MRAYFGNGNDVFAVGKGCNVDSEHNIIVKSADVALVVGIAGTSLVMFRRLSENGLESLLGVLEPMGPLPVTRGG